MCFHALQGSASINLYVDQDYAAVFLDLRGDISLLPDLDLPTLEGELGVLLTVGFGSVSMHGVVRTGFTRVRQANPRDQCGCKKLVRVLWTLVLSSWGIQERRPRQAAAPHLERRGTPSGLTVCLP